MYNFYITPEEYEIAEKNGIGRHTLDNRIWNLAWDKKRAITERPKRRRKFKHLELARKNGIPDETFRMRVRRGMDELEAAQKPLQNKIDWSLEMRNRRKFKYPNWVYEKARENGISHSSLTHRIESGRYTLKQACTMKPLNGEECARRAHLKRRGEIV